MPFAVVLVVLDAFFIIHAAKTGRFWPWAYVIIMLPGLGMLGYVVIELLPEWMGSAPARNAQRRIARRINPQRRYRELTEQLQIADTIATRAELAEECLVLDKFDEGLRHYEQILAQPLGDDPIYLVRKARAELGMGRPQDAVETLDELRRRFPDFQSADAHLIYARALTASGRTAEALEEFHALSGYYPGAEPRVRYGQLLKALGRGAEARAVFEDVVRQLRRAPQHARRLQAEWIAAAEQELRG
jgi:hypothetical protein